MKRILLAAIACLSLLAALPALSSASEHHRGRDANRHRHRTRLEHFREHGQNDAGVAGTVKSFTGGVLTITLADHSTVSGDVKRDTEVSCEAMNDRFSTEDRGPGPSGSGGDRGDQGGDRGDQGDRGDRGDRGDQGDRRDEGDQAACLMALQTAGTPVREATLRISSRGAIWQEVELIS